MGNYPNRGSNRVRRGLEKEDKITNGKPKKGRRLNVWDPYKGFTSLDGREEKEKKPSEASQKNGSLCVRRCFKKLGKIPCREMPVG